MGILACYRECFIEYKDKSLESLWKKLNDLGINTIHQATHIPKDGEAEGTLKKKNIYDTTIFQGETINDIPIQNLSGGNL